MGFNSYGYIEELSMSSRTFDVTVSALDKIIQVTENGSLLASLSFALNNNILQLIGKNNLEVASIELPNSDTITNAFYDKENKKIVLEILMADGSLSTIDIDVADLIVIYEGGNGIEIDDSNNINVKIADNSKQYLIADSNGLALKFNTLDEHFINTEEIELYATKVELNTINNNLTKSIENIEGQIPNLATKQDLTSLATKEEVNNIQFEVNVLKQDVDKKANIDDVNAQLNNKVDWNLSSVGKSITLNNTKSITYDDDQLVNHNVINAINNNLTIGDENFDIKLITKPNTRVSINSNTIEQIAYLSDIQKLQDEIDNNSELNNNKYATKESVSELENSLNEKIKLKADTQIVNDLTSVVETKASQTSLNETNQLLSTKASQLDLDKTNSSLELKANKEYVDELNQLVQNKVDWTTMDNNGKAILLNSSDKIQIKDIDSIINDVVSITNKNLNIGNYNNQFVCRTIQGTHPLCQDKLGSIEEMAFLSDISSSSSDINDKLTVINNNINNIQNDLQDKANQSDVDDLANKIEVANNGISHNLSEINNINKTKQDKLVHGKGILIQDNVISCTLDESPYIITNTLPEVGNPNKIYVVPAKDTDPLDDNNKMEYLYDEASHKYEKFGSFQPKVDLEPYALKTDLEPYALKTDFPQLIEGFVNSKVDGLASKTEVNTLINNSASSVTEVCKQYAREQDIIVRNDLSTQITTETQKQNDAINKNSQAIIVLQNRCDHFDDIIGQITVEHGHGITSRIVANVYTKQDVDAQISSLKAEIQRLTNEINTLKNK